MKVLIVTQVVDRKDPSLGFFTNWIEEFSRAFPVVSVVCLRKGDDLPHGVPVYSLGKETRTKKRTTDRFFYITRFLSFAWRTRREYDTVFVHMNEEYVLLAGLMWNILGKRVFLWRNHYAGSWKTNLAIMLCHKVFCTSVYSYTARSKKVTFMPVGIVPSLQDRGLQRKPSSILFLGRFDESKHPDLLVDALSILHKGGVHFEATFVGGPSRADSPFPDMVKKKAQESSIGEMCTFVGAVPSTSTEIYYASHEIYVNCSRSGMFDKTMFEAAANGCIVLSSSKDMEVLLGKEVVFADGDVNHLARLLEMWLSATSEQKNMIRSRQKEVVEEHSLATLSVKLGSEMSI